MALLTGISIVTLVYLSINIAYFVVLDVDTMKSSNAVAAVSYLTFFFGIFTTNIFSCSVKKHWEAFHMRSLF